MILAPLADADRYASLHPRFAKAIAWLRDPANLALPVGRYDLEGDKLRAIVDETATEPATMRRLECHRRYIDIQFSISGGEIMEWAPITGLTPTEPFNTERDLGFFVDPTGPLSQAVVKPGWLAIFWPEDAHKPLCNLGATAQPVKKIVIKVEV